LDVNDGETEFARPTRLGVDSVGPLTTVLSEAADKGNLLYLLRHSTRLGVPVLVVLAAFAAALASPVSAQEPPPPDQEPSYVYRIVCRSGKVVLASLPMVPEPQKTDNEASARRGACPGEREVLGPSYVYRIVCKSGKVVLATLPTVPEPQKTQSEASARSGACYEDDVFLPGYQYRIVCKSGKVVLDHLPYAPEPHKTRNEALARRAACPQEYDASGRRRVPLAPLPRIDDTDLFRQTLGDIVGNTFRLRVTCPKACVLRSEVELVVADKRLLLYGNGPRHRLVAGRVTTIPIRFSASTRAKIRGAKLVRVNGFLDVSDSRGGKRTVTWRRTCRLGG
jgi:hypothetical protein